MHRMSEIRIEHKDKILRIGDIKIEILLDADVWNETWYFTIRGLHRAIHEYINGGELERARRLRKQVKTYEIDAYDDYEENRNIKSETYLILTTLSRERQKKGQFCYPIYTELSKHERSRRRLTEDGGYEDSRA